ncbi:MAG: EAL domain-containing protein [Motiliproteus sp.]
MSDSFSNPEPSREASTLDANTFISQLRRQKRFGSLKVRLLLLLLLLSLPSIGMLSYHAVEERELAISQSHQKALDISRQITFSQKKVIQRTRHYLEQLVTSPALQHPEDSSCSAYLASALKLNSALVNIGVPLPNGDLLCNALPLPGRINVADRRYFQHSLNMRSFAIGEFQNDRAAQITSVNFSIPVISPQTNAVVGVAVAVVPLNWWSEQLAEFNLPHKSIAIISDDKGTVIASFPDSVQAQGKNRRQLGLLANSPRLKDFDSETVIDTGGVTRIYMHSILYQTAQGSRISLSVGIPADAAIRMANKNFVLSFALFLGAVSAVTLLAFRILKYSIIRPLNELTAATETLQSGQLCDNLSYVGSRELVSLQHCFQQMASTRVHAEQAAIKSNEELNSVFEALPDLYFRLSAEGIILDYKAQKRSDLYVAPELFLGRRMVDVLPPTTSIIFETHLDWLKRGSRSSCFEYPLEVNNELRFFEARVNTIKGCSDLVVVARDITVKKASDDHIHHQANFDALTGLPNRNMLYDRINQEIKKSHRSKLPLAILFLDLDGFKVVNDTLGHDQGDYLLTEVAKRLCHCVREEDTVARQGGDEFSIILGQLKDAAIVEGISEAILKELKKPFNLDGELVHISGSIGITFYPQDARRVDDLLKAADQAMYAAKDKGRNRFNYFTRSMQDTAIAKMRLVNDLRTAVDEHQFVLHYQPIVTLGSGAIDKAEALIRWQHPLRGLISPDHFISVAEESRIIIGIGNWVFQEAARQVRRLRATGAGALQISINASPVQLSTTNSGIEQWRLQLQDLQLGGDAIITEITEGLMMDAKQETTHKLLTFKEAGIQVALDDFGTGYSSLSYIREYDIDYIKIDRSFVCNITTSTDAYALCEAIIVMAHKLGIEVIAEGIETRQQLKLLMTAGCDFGQGFLFAKPQDITSFESILKNQPYLHQLSSICDDPSGEGIDSAL